MLNENYHGEIYHFTSLIQASWIVDDDCISSHLAMSDECGRGYREDARKYVDSETPFISFTRDKNYHIQGNNSTIVCFVFDGDSIQNIRNARLYPYAYNTDNRGESEERIFGVDIYPLHNYLKRIEITISDKEYSWASDRNFDEEGELYDEFSERFPDLNDLEISHKISDFLISKITNNKLFSNKVIIHSSINCNINMNKKLIRLTESDLHRIVKESVSKILSEAINELDPRTYASYADKRAAQGKYDKAVQGQNAAVDSWNKQYGRSQSIPNGFAQKAKDNTGQWDGYNHDSYRMKLNAKDPNKPINWDSPDYWKDEYDNHGYGTERWQSSNYPGPNNMDDQETYTTYDPSTDKTNSTTYGRMKYNTVGSVGKMGYNDPKFGDYNGRPIRGQNNWSSGLEGDKVARQMAQGNGKYIKGQGWQ